MVGVEKENNETKAQLEKNLFTWKNTHAGKTAKVSLFSKSFSFIVLNPTWFTVLWIWPALSHICLGGPSSSVSPTHNCGSLLILQGSVQKKFPWPCPAPLCIMRSCTHIVNSLFSLSFTNLYYLSHYSNCHNVLCIGGIREVFLNGFSIFTTKYDQMRSETLKMPSVIKTLRKTSQVDIQNSGTFLPDSKTLQEQGWACLCQGRWKPWLLAALWIYLLAAVSAFLRKKACITHSSLKAALDSAASPETLAFTSQEEWAPQGLGTAK